MQGKEATSANAPIQLSAAAGGSESTNNDNQQNNDKSQQAYIKEYAGAAAHWRLDKHQGPRAPHSVADCHTDQQLDDWYHAQQKTVNEYVPKAYRDGPLKRL